MFHSIYSYLMVFVASAGKAFESVIFQLKIHGLKLSTFWNFSTSESFQLLV